MRNCLLLALEEHLMTAYDFWIDTVLASQMLCLSTHLRNTRVITVYVHQLISSLWRKRILKQIGNDFEAMRVNHMFFLSMLKRFIYLSTKYREYSKTLSSITFENEQTNKFAIEKYVAHQIWSRKIGYFKTI